jgi:phosphate transport system substrate-binding protein
MIDSMRVAPQYQVLAYDAIVVIVNPKAPDSLFSMEQLKNIIKGTDTSWVPVFDGVNATSTVRFILDSILKQDNLGPHVKAADNSAGVIDYVSKVPNAIGFLGVSWLGNPEDSSQVVAMQKVKMAYLQSVDSPDVYVKPSQAGIYNGRYPMVRNLVYVLKEKYVGLAHGFAYFLRNERGQLAFRRAYLKPATRPYRQRKAALKE